MSDCTGGLVELLDSDLLSAGWIRGYTPTTDTRADKLQYACDALRRSLLKKYIRFDDKDAKQRADQAALSLFLKNNEDCRNVSFSAAEGDYAPEAIQTVLGEMEGILYDVHHPHKGGGILLSLGNILSKADQGPGASVGSHNNDFYTKMFAGTLASSSPELHEYYRAHIAYFDSWSAAEKSRHTRFSDRLVAGSNLFFALKNAEISRVACTEPPMNMFFQKGVQLIYEGALQDVFGIDIRGSREHNVLSQPEKNRLLAKIGSIDQSFGTIDLTSASDLNSCKLVERFIPETSARWLWKTRSPFTKLPNGELQELYMISSMGNAFTFPLETIIFASVVMASYRYLGIKPIKPRGSSLGNFAVFGDDIIVKTEAYSLVTQVLSTIGHRVNHDKSYKEGLFRESCGQDFYSGYNVRGVYIKSLQTDADIFSAINRLNVWSTRHGIPLTGSIQYLADHARHKLYVPMHESVTGGIRAPLCYVRRLFSEDVYSHGELPASRTLAKFRTGLRFEFEGGYKFSYLALRPKCSSVSLADVESLQRFIKLLDRNHRGSPLEVFEQGFRRWRKTTSVAMRHHHSMESCTQELPTLTGKRYSRKEIRALERKLERFLGLRGDFFALMKFLRRFEGNPEGVLLSALAGKLRDTTLVIKEFETRFVTNRVHSPCWDYVPEELIEMIGPSHDDLLVMTLVNLG